jgi:hypothetical protein
MRKFFAKDDFGLAAFVAVAAIVAMVIEVAADTDGYAMGTLAGVVGLILLVVSTD